MSSTFAPPKITRQDFRKIKQLYSKLHKKSETIVYSNPQNWLNTYFWKNPYQKAVLNYISGL
ncbi:MAG: hypothetical protein ABIF92_03085, partial [archaeon]